MALPRFTFYGEVKEGVLRLFNSSRYHEVLKEFEGKKVNVSVGLQIETRTEKQNRFYWVYLQIISSETGHREEELHEIFKRELLLPREVEMKGNKYLVTPSTARLTKDQFTEYMHRIEELTQVPLPDTELFVGEKLW